MCCAFCGSLAGWWRCWNLWVANRKGYSPVGTKCNFVLISFCYDFSLLIQFIFGGGGGVGKECFAFLIIIFTYREKMLLLIGFDLLPFQLGMNFDLVRSNSSIIHAFPFNSEKKRGGVAVKLVMTDIQHSESICDLYYFSIFQYNVIVIWGIHCEVVEYIV